MKVTFTKDDKKKRIYGPNERLKRVLNLLYMLLKEENKDVEYYADVLKCGRSAVKRYIDDIRLTYNMGEEYRFFDIEYDKKEKCYKLITKKDVFVNFSLDEIEALYMAVKSFSGLEGTPLEHLEDVENKVSRYYQASLSQTRNKSICLSAPKTKSKLSELLKDINTAMTGKEKKKLIISYTKTYSKEKERKEIVPYSIMVFDFEWYLKGFCLKDNILKTYVINEMKIEAIEELSKDEKEKLPKNPDISPIHLWDWVNKNEQAEPVSVELKFTGPMTERIRKKFKYRTEHPSQEVIENDQFTTVCFKVKNPIKMIPWIMKYGPYVEVVKPEELRNEMKKNVQAIAVLYE